MVSLPISVPQNANLLVKVGDHVVPGQKLAEVVQEEEPIINIPELLKVPLKKVPSILQFQPGDRVEIGDILAIRKNAFGMVAAKLKSNVSGTILRFDPDSGMIAIGNPRKIDESSVLLSPLAGVIQLCDNNQIVIETDEHVISGIGGIGTKIQGKIYLLPNIKQEQMEQQQLLLELNSSIADRIVLGRQLNLEVLVKIIGIGAAGVIATHIDPTDLTYLQQKKLAIPLIVVHEDQLPVLVKQSEKEVFLDGATYTILLLA
ncbi:MAG TPA: hypothetical protein VMR41_04585 [Patescibacteria group bacterium]|nr:hypothetical protein [Patescibacteria group bacterium]